MIPWNHGKKIYLNFGKALLPLTLSYRDSDCSFAIIFARKANKILHYLKALYEIFIFLGVEISPTRFSRAWLVWRLFIEILVFIGIALIKLFVLLLSLFMRYIVIGYNWLLFDQDCIDGESSFLKNYIWFSCNV